MSTINLTSRVTQSQEQVSCELDDELVLMSVKNGKYYSMNPMACTIWKLLENPLKVSALCDLLQQDYQVNRMDCEKEVMSFLNAFLDEGVIEIQ
jgi:coenzyme PQQ synthesis protein D (PqqD)